jgi:small subunit ribosomal protein S6
MPEETKDINEPKVYEASYHLVPTMAEDAVPAEADKIKSLITELGGEVISDAAPELKNLAYSISKTVKAVKSNYNKAYFGWVKFTLTPESVEKVKTALDASETVVRYLIVSTVKESTLLADKEHKHAPKPTSAAAQEDMDKSIDDLVIS